MFCESFVLGLFGAVRDSRHAIPQDFALVDDRVQSFVVTAVVDRFGRIFQQVLHRLDFSYGVVALVLTWSRRRTDVHQVVDAVGDGSRGRRQLVFAVGQVRIGREGLGSGQKATGSGRDALQRVHHLPSDFRVLGLSGHLHRNSQQIVEGHGEVFRRRRQLSRTAD
jgi:hypothetical protein